MKRLFFILCLFFIGIGTGFSQTDDQFVYHTVEPKETLYSLVKRYNTNFATVENLNPELAGGVTDIKIGQVIKFPKVNTHVSKNKRKIHIAKAKETVYSISKLYDLDISNFVEVNKIQDNYIRIGDTLIVDSGVLSSEAAKIVRDDELKIEEKGRKITEIGIAEIIYSQIRGNKFLALHRTAPIGSTIKVTNEATGHTIIAKVIGNLNEKGPDENILLKLSPSAYYQLRPKDAKLRARVEYYM